jgi:aconitate hydratase
MDSFKVKKTLELAGQNRTIYSLKRAEANGLGGIKRMPISRKILLENLLRHEDGDLVSTGMIESVAAGAPEAMFFYPARIYMHDLLGLPLLADLASLRDAVIATGRAPEIVNPIIPVDIVMDHSLMVVHTGDADAERKNQAIEFERNEERFALAKWCQENFNNFRVIPPGKGIMHQINVEYLGQVVWRDGQTTPETLYPDTVLGTDSHTPMVNGLGVLGWGVGGIEAEAAMMGFPVSLNVPDVIGVHLSGQMREGITATDLVLTITERMREYGVVGKFIEFFGEGLDHLPLADRATISNMTPEFGATCTYFPVDEETLRYMRLTGREPDHISVVEAYAKEQGMWRTDEAIEFNDVIELDLSTIGATLAGPRRPHDRVALGETPANFTRELASYYHVDAAPGTRHEAVAGQDHDLTDGDILVAAITSCTNTSNPPLLIGAALLAKKAIERGLTTKPWIKKSLAPGSQVVGDYLAKAGLQPYLDQLGFNIVGYGCTTCGGMAGPLSDEITATLEESDKVCCAVLSGNRNFEARIHPLAKANYLASPPLVVAYALTGTVLTNLETDPLGKDLDGNPVYLKDIWPSTAEIQEALEGCLSPDMFTARYNKVFEGNHFWEALSPNTDTTYRWDEASTYIRRPPYFDDVPETPHAIDDIHNIRPLAILGDTITTDHISPASAIKLDSPGGEYLSQRQVAEIDFNTYGTRRSNFEMVERSTLANVRLRNEMLPGTEGGVTRLMPEDTATTIFDAAAAYKERGVPTMIIAGKEYRAGSSRDTAAKGVYLLGVKLVLAESFERIHRSNLVGMGVLPLQFMDGMDRTTLTLDGSEWFDLTGISHGLTPSMTATLTIHRINGDTEDISVLVRVDTGDEAMTVAEGGILQRIYRNLPEPGATAA